MLVALSFFLFSLSVSCYFGLLRLDINLSFFLIITFGTILRNDDQSPELKVLFKFCKPMYIYVPILTKVDLAPVLHVVHGWNY